MLWLINLTYDFCSAAMALLPGWDFLSEEKTDGAYGSSPVRPPFPTPHEAVTSCAARYSQKTLVNDVEVRV